MSETPTPTQTTTPKKKKTKKKEETQPTPTPTPPTPTPPKEEVTQPTTPPPKKAPKKAEKKAEKEVKKEAKETKEAKPETKPPTKKKPRIKTTTWEEFDKFKPKTEPKRKSWIKEAIERATKEPVEIRELTRGQILALINQVERYNKKYMDRIIDIKYDIKRGIVLLAPTKKYSPTQ